jgi:hypothetical protein
VGERATPVTEPLDALTLSRRVVDAHTTALF